ncbi:MAG: VOC family protein [Candidatus Nanopelagicales bacterium]
MTTAPATNDDRTISAGTTMDAVTLRVGDLDLMTGYYSDAIALVPIEERSRGREVHRVLGRGHTPMIRLVHTPDLPAGNPREAGLFHTAFLFDDPASLAATVYRAALDPRSRFTGAADHLVSEAFYFTDPEGNGIELYVDRPRQQWQHSGGELQMATLPLDPNAYLHTHLTREAIDAGPARAGRIGHVHLQVGDLDIARDFYIDTLGFEVTVASYPGALFAAAGGYHHHLGMNTWNSRGAGPRAVRLGLGNLAITVPTRDDLDAITARLQAGGWAFGDTGHGIEATDPWNTQVTLSLPGTTTDELLDR